MIKKESARGTGLRRKRNDQLNSRQIALQIPPQDVPSVNKRVPRCEAARPPFEKPSAIRGSVIRILPPRKTETNDVAPGNIEGCTRRG